MELKLLLFAAVGIYGVLYAINPQKFLERKGDREVTPQMIRTARIAGIVMTAACVVLMISTAAKGA